MKEFLQREQSRILILIHRLVCIITFFTTSFLTIYFLNITNWDLRVLSMHYITNYISILLCFFALGLILHKSNIIPMYRIGIAAKVAYLVLILFMKDSIKDYIIMLGVVKGIGEAFYWVPRHYMTFKMNKSSQAKKFFSIDQAIANVQDIVVPITLGGIIGASSGVYTPIIGIMVIILLLAFIVSGWLDLGVIDVEPIQIENFKKLLNSKHAPSIKKAYLSTFFTGIATNGVLTQVINMLIYLVYKSEFGLGTFKSVPGLIIAVIMFIIGHYLKDEKFKNVLKITGILGVCSLLLLVYKVNSVTLIVYSVITGIAFAITGIIASANLVKLLKHESEKKYTLENIIINETAVTAGRVLGYSVLYSLGTISPDASGLKIVLIFLTICVAMRVLELILSIKDEEEHTNHAFNMLKFNLRTFKFYMKKSI